MSKIFTVKEENDMLHILDFETAKTIATIQNKDVIVFLTNEPVDKGILQYIINLLLDFEGYVRIYKTKDKDLFGY